MSEGEQRAIPKNAARQKVGRKWLRTRVSLRFRLCPLSWSSPPRLRFARSWSTWLRCVPASVSARQTIRSVSPTSPWVSSSLLRGAVRRSRRLMWLLRWEFPLLRLPRSLRRWDGRLSPPRRKWTSTLCRLHPLHKTPAQAGVFLYS